jgi:hypothetical protein
MEMVYMIWVTRPQYGREPPAARAPYGLHVQRLLGTCFTPNRNAPPIREHDRGDVYRDSLAMWVYLSPGNSVDVAAIIAGAGIERDDRRSQHSIPKWGHEVSQILSEGEGERAVEQWMRRELEFASAVEADRSDSNWLADAASVGRCVRRGGGIGFDLTRFEFVEASSGSGLRLE